MAENKTDLEKRLVELREEYQNALTETRNLEDPQYQNGAIDAGQVRLDAIQNEIKQVEKQLKKLDKE